MVDKSMPVRSVDENMNIEKAMKNGLSLVIPAFNEEGPIGSVVNGFREFLESTGADFEIIVVDDCSTDRTGEYAAASGAKVIRHQRNRGYGAALKTGIRRSRYELIGIADSDGQHTPQQMADLLEGLNDADVVVGQRTTDSHVPLSRRPGKQILKWVANWVTGSKIPDLNSGLRVMHRDAILDCMHLAPNGFSFSTTTSIAFQQSGFLVNWVPITTPKREGRKSSVSMIRDGLNTLLLIIRIVVLFAPLRVFLPVSAFLFLIGAISSIKGLITDWNIGDKEVIILLTSFIIFFYGILADQLSAIRRELKRQ